MHPRNQKYIAHTYQLAEEAVKNGDHPFGALAVDDDSIVATALNQVVTENDGTKHAELNLASLLSRNFPRSAIERMTIYCSTEPCVMCAGALFWIGCRHIVYGCSTQTLGRHTTESFSVAVRDALASVTSQMKIEGPVNERDGNLIHSKFWHQFGGKK